MIFNDLRRATGAAAAALEAAGAADLELLQRVLGKGSLAGDYVRAGSALWSDAERLAALERLRDRQLEVGGDHAGAAAILLAIRRADDAQTVRLGERWVIDAHGCKRTLIPSESYSLADGPTFATYLAQVASQLLNWDADDRASGHLTRRPLIDLDSIVVFEDDDEFDRETRARFEHVLGLLTKRELRVVKLTARGWTQQRIAHELRISAGALRVLWHRLRTKLSGKAF